MTRLVNKDPKKVEAVIKADPEALALFREAMKQQEGGNKRSVADVMAGKVSPNAETKKQT